MLDTENTIPRTQETKISRTESLSYTEFYLYLSISVSATAPIPVPMFLTRETSVTHIELTGNGQATKPRLPGPRKMFNASSVYHKGGNFWVVGRCLMLYYREKGEYIC